MKERTKLATPLLAGLFFGLPMGLFAWLSTGRLLLGSVVGLAAGMLFAAAIAVFVEKIRRGGQDEREMFGDPEPFGPDEPVLREGLANHFKGLEGVGGKLYLTDRRLRFISHKINIQRHDESYPLDQIAGAEATRTLGIIPNGLRVTSLDGRRERFVVHHRSQWVEAIDGARQAVARPAAADGAGAGAAT